MPSNTKKCSGMCGKRKGLTKFNDNKKAKDGKHPVCKECQNAYLAKARATRAANIVARAQETVESPKATAVKSSKGQNISKALKRYHRRRRQEMEEAKVVQAAALTISSGTDIPRLDQETLYRHRQMLAISRNPADYLYLAVLLNGSDS